VQHLVRDLLCLSKDIRFNAVGWDHFLFFGIHFNVPVFSVYPKFNTPNRLTVCVRYSIFSHNGLVIGL